MVGYAGSSTRTVYVGVTLTRSKVKVNLMGLLNFRQIVKPCMLASMTAARLRGYLVRLSPTDDLVDWNFGVSFCLSVRPGKVFQISIKFGVWVDLDYICAPV